MGQQTFRPPMQLAEQVMPEWRRWYALALLIA